MEVHRELRHGLLESVYQDALAVEFLARRIQFDRERLLKVFYKGAALPSFFKSDFVCFGSVIVECKSQTSLSAADDAQTVNYLRITGLERAIILNFGTTSLQHKRLVLTADKSKQSFTADLHR